MDGLLALRECKNKASITKELDMIQILSSDNILDGEMIGQNFCSLQ